MVKGGGKSKGGGFEREVCKKLSLWIDDTRDDIFWRSAMSGGRATVGFKKGNVRTSQVGDISAIDVLGQKFIDTFIVECKFYRNIHLHSLMFSKPKGNTIYGFWEKLCRDAEQIRKEPLLIIKQNGWPSLIGISDKGLFFKFLKENNYLKPLSHFYSSIPGCVLYEFDVLLKEVDSSFLEILKNGR